MTPVPVPAPPASEPAAARSSWLDTATLVLLTTSWVYLTGWAYAWRFFSHVQLGLLALDIPKEYFFVYGLWVCQRWALLLVPVLLGMIWLTWYRRRHPTSVWSSKPAVLVVAFVLFVLAYGLGVESGSGHYGLQQQQDFPAMPRVGGVPITCDGCKNILVFRCFRGVSHAIGTLPNIAIPQKSPCACRLEC